MGGRGKHSLSVRQLLAVRGVSSELAKRIQDTDVDGNGEISIEELVVVLQREQNATQNIRVLRKLVLLLAVSLIVLIAATAGVTYGMVYALKDTKVDNAVMVTKGTDAPVATGTVLNATDLESLYMVPAIEQLVGIDKIVIVASDNASVTVYHVASIDLVPGVRATINTTDLQTINVDSSGIHKVTSLSSTGRRLLIISWPPQNIISSFGSGWSVGKSGSTT